MKNILELVYFCHFFLGYRLVVFIAIAMLASILELGGILLLLPFLYLLGNNDSSVDDSSSIDSFVTEAIIYLFTWTNVPFETVNILFFLVLITLLKGVAMFGTHVYMSLMRARLMSSVRIWFLTSLFNQSRLYSLRAGEVATLFTEQVTRAVAAFEYLCRMSVQVIFALGYIYFGFAISSSFGVAAALSAIVIFVLFRRVNSYVIELSTKITEGVARLNSRVIEVAQASEYLNATGKMGRLLTPIRQQALAIGSAEKEAGIARGFTASVREPLVISAIGLIVVYQMVYLGRPIEAMIVSILLFYRGFNSIMSVQGWYQNTLDNLGSIFFISKQVFGVHKKSKRLGQLSEMVGEPEDILIPEFPNSINLSRVVVTRGGGAFKTPELNLQITRGQFIGIIGVSGGGKSSILRLLSGLSPGDSGDLVIDGSVVDFSGRNLRFENIGYVCQESMIFEGSVLYNLCLVEVAKSDQDLIGRCWAVLDKVGLSAHIESLEHGIYTMIGERGLSLSGGQRQRLFIARELLSQPDLLLLDEPTSSLDATSERGVAETLMALKGETTIVCVSHNSKVIEAADQVYEVRSDGVVRIS